MWEELVGLVSTIEFTKEVEAFMWQFQSSAVYSSQSLYVVINFRGVKHVYLPTVWKIVVPQESTSSCGYFPRTNC
jgi:hypothetical protein